MYDIIFNSGRIGFLIWMLPFAASTTAAAYYFTSDKGSEELKEGDLITLVAESVITMGVSGGGRGIIIAVDCDGTSIDNLDVVAVHELGHFVADFLDTNYRIHNGPETVMQFDGGDSKETFLSCRKVPKVETGEGTPKGEYESHWDDAKRE